MKGIMFKSAHIQMTSITHFGELLFNPVYPNVSNNVNQVYSALDTTPDKSEMFSYSL